MSKRRLVLVITKKKNVYFTSSENISNKTVIIAPIDLSTYYGGENGEMLYTSL
jgi:hypothetical protein